MGIKCKLHNDTDPRFPQECVEICGKTIRKNGAIECSNIGVCKGTYDTVTLEKGEKSQAVRSYADVAREDVQTPLRQNRLIIPEFIYFIKIYLHWERQGLALFIHCLNAIAGPGRNDCFNNIS